MVSVYVASLHVWWALQAELLPKLRAGGHRCIIFTQFSRMLDVLESWINYQGFVYLRLDGSTKVRSNAI